MKNIFNNSISIILTSLIYILGGLDIALKSLIIIVIIDYITGIISAIYNKKLNSKVGFKGILKKVVYFFAIALSVVIDNLSGQTGVIRNLIIYFFVANDSLSIIENLAEMNVKLPKKLVEVLEQLKTKGE